ncbi:MAG TPA: hypothetical protein VGM23_11740, partial [Armatimonadota bacterium]
MEISWQLENYLASRPEAKRQELLRLAREGKIGIQGLYANELTGLLSHESAARLTWLAAQAHR